jgi:hypothetical protein
VKVSIKGLREISNRLLDHVESLGVKEVELSEDYYWTFPQDQLNDPTLATPKPSRGQLTDDRNELRLIKRGERPVVAIALSWLSAIMRAVGGGRTGT